MREQVIQVVEKYIDAVRVTTPPHFLFIPMPSASSPQTRIAALRRFGRASASLPAS